MARTIGNAAIWRSGIVPTTTTVVIRIVRPEVLLFKVHWLIGFRKAITPRNHEIFKPASKPNTQTSGE